MSDIWELLNYFKHTENWGDASKMNADFLWKLDQFRGVVGKPFTLTCPAWSIDGHSPNSYHYKGMAVDGRFIEPGTRQPLSLTDHIMIALKAPFNGVGIYTWSPQGPFLHLDDRKSEERKIWVCRKKGVYENLSPEFLRWALNIPSQVVG